MEDAFINIAKMEEEFHKQNKKHSGKDHNSDEEEEKQNEFLDHGALDKPRESRKSLGDEYLREFNAESDPKFFG